MKGLVHYLGPITKMVNGRHVPIATEWVYDDGSKIIDLLHEYKYFLKELQQEYTDYKIYTQDF